MCAPSMHQSMRHACGYMKPTSMPLGPCGLVIAGGCRGRSACSAGVPSLLSAGIFSLPVMGPSLGPNAWLSKCRRHRLSNFCSVLQRPATSLDPDFSSSVGACGTSGTDPEEGAPLCEARAVLPGWWGNYVVRKRSFLSMEWSKQRPLGSLRQRSSRVLPRAFNS